MPHHTPLISTIVVALALAWLLGAIAHRLKASPRRDEKISMIALDAGFSDLSYFNRTFRRRYGETPSGIRMFPRNVARA
jgi:methylphosphotriester-DNA--protein-cysteine methyltransferase